MNSFVIQCSQELEPCLCNLEKLTEQKVNILLVDNSVANLLLLEEKLNQLEQNLVKALSGEKVLSQIIEQEFAVILINVQIEEMNGFETAELIRKNPKNQQTPIIFLSTFAANEQMVLKGYEVGAVDYVCMETQTEILLAKITFFVNLFKKNLQLNYVNKELQTKLKESLLREQRLQKQVEIIDLVQEAIIIRDGDGMITFWNCGAEKIYGFSQQEAVGKEFSSLLKVRFPKPLPELHNCLFECGKWEGELIHSQKNGTEILVASYWVLQQNNRGETEIVEINRNITKYKQTEEALLTAGIRLAGILDNASDAILSVESSHKIVLFSKEAEKVFGYTTSEILGQTLDLLIPKHLPNGDSQYLFTSYNSNTANRNLGERREMTGCRKNGAFFPIEVSISPLELVSSNAFTVILRDLTELKATEAALRRTEAQFQAFMNHIPPLSWITDGEGQLVYCNKSFERWYQRSTWEIIGKTIFDFNPPHLAQQHLEHIQHVLQTGQVLEVNESAMSSDGTLSEFLVYKFPMFDIDEQLLVGGVAVDITERKQAEADLQIRNQELLTLYKLSEVALRTNSLKLAAQDAVTEISHATGFPKVTIELYDPASQMMRFVGTTGVASLAACDTLEVPVERTLSGTVVLTGKPMIKIFNSHEIESSQIRIYDSHQTIGQLNIRTFVCQPMIVNQQVIGVLTLAHPERVQLDASFLRLLTSLANFVASLVERKQAEIALHESEELYRQMFQTNLAIKLLIERDTGVIVDANPAACRFYGYSLKHLKQMMITDINVLPAEQVFSLMQQYLFNQQSYFQFRHKLASGEIRDVEIYSCPVTRQGKTLLYSVVHDISALKQAKRDLEQANFKLNSWVEELEIRNREIALLSQLSDILQACLSIDEAHQALARLVQPLFPDVSGAVFVLNNSENLLEAVATWGEVNETTELVFAPGKCWGLRRGRSHLADRTTESILCQHRKKDCCESSTSIESLCIPMMAQGEALGVLYLSSNQPDKLTEAKQQFAITAAEHIALGLANLQLHEALQQQSIRDPLTGLFNRRYLEESLEREISRADRKQQSVGIIMLDIDNFKRFNDTFGQNSGDNVLQELAKFLEKNIRGGDIACRYGGEEIVLILPEASLDATKKRAEQIREDVKHLYCHNRYHSLTTITISLGVAVFPDDGLTGEAIIAAANTALYHAKQEGRDRVVTATDLSVD
ncbi:MULTISPECIES: PAS domain S-box protein [Nostocales]|uniref:PAS domain S-box protein n=3 Tax=Nostocales TaxID=1161 RepID=A0ABW8WKP2_9CYAN